MDWRSQVEMFMPHGMCLLWSAELMSLHIISDALIALAYFTIPFSILRFVRGRGDLERRHLRLAVLFAAFISLCGLTHVVSIIVLWEPIYIFEGWLKGATAIVSIATAGWLIALVPHALKLPSLTAMQAEIAARQQTHAELEETTRQLALSEERYALALRGMSVGVWDWNTVTDGLYWSDRFLDILGVAKAGFRGHLAEFTDRLHPDDKAATLATLRGHIDRKNGYDVEYRLRHNQGHYIWVHATGQATWDEHGAPIHMSGSASDITTIKRQQQALIESEKTFRRAIENAVIGNALVAPNGGWLTVNRALCALVGFSEAELLEGGFDLIHHPDDPWSLQETITALTAGDANVVGGERRLRRRDGHHLWVQVCASLVTRDGGAPDYLVVQFQDMTERKRAEIVKDEFVSTVNHELRTPLTSIFGALRLLGATAADALDAKSARLLEIAQVSCTQLTRLVDDILDIEKIAAGQMDYHLEMLAAGPLIEGIINRHSAIADHYGIRFTTLLELDNLAIRVDPNRFSQALVNLLSNAAKYSHQGGEVSIVARQDGDTAIRISVSDFGSGIPEAFHSRIFGRFAQADNSTTRQAGGSGLGLNITKTLIEAFGGTVSFDSIEGVGATFNFVLPLFYVMTNGYELQSHG